jgi:phytol kinase
MVNPWLGIGLVLAILVGLMAALRLFQRLAAPHPELVRKLLHMGMGLVTLTFPWLFDTAWPIVLLAVLSIIGLLAVRLVSGLKSSVGGVIGGVERASLGEIYFPLAVAILFILFLYGDEVAPERRLLLYCIPVLLLTVADAAAALIGVAYGRWRYPTADGQKTAEGSLAFFICAFFIVHVPLLLCTTTGRAETLLIALLLAWLATMFEAIAWSGLDNLVLPLVSYLLLEIYLPMPVEQLGQRLIAAGLLMVVLYVCRHLTTLAGSALLGAFLVGYISWALGGWPWLRPPLILFLTYTLFSRRREPGVPRNHNVHAVVCVASAGLVWLFLAKILDAEDEFLFPYTLAFAAHLAIIAVSRLRHEYPKVPGMVMLGLCIAEGWLFLFVPYLLAQGFTQRTLKESVIGLVGVAVAAAAFYWSQPGMDDCPADTPRWWRQATDAALGSMVGLMVLYVF